MREHGHRVGGVWHTDVGELGTVNYLLAWDSLDERAAANDRLWSDQVWRDAYYSTPPLTTTRASEIWRPARYSPKLQATWPDGTTEHFG